MYAFGKYSRKACRAGKVIIRSPIAQGRRMSMCFSGGNFFAIFDKILNDEIRNTQFNPPPFGGKGEDFWGLFRVSFVLRISFFLFRACLVLAMPA